MINFFLYQAKRISFSDQGKGNVVVFLHGFVESKHIWNSYAQEMASKYRVICIDLPGHGKSEVVAEVHSMNLMAEVVYSVLLHLEVKSCLIVGHSMGGYVALAFAKKHESMLKGLILFHSQANSDSLQAKNNRDRLVEIVRNNKSQFITSFFPSLLAECNREKYSDEIQMLRNEANLISKEGIIAAILGIKEREDMRSMLGKLKIEVLFILGDSDERIPLELVKDQLVLSKKINHIILNDVGHLGFIEAKGSCYLTLVQFAGEVL